MHAGNRNWLDDLQARFAGEIAGASLLEIGSLNINGSARECLRPARWVGVDRLRCGRADCPSCGDGTVPARRDCDVEIQCDADQTCFEPESFDILLSTSMLEHDPGWRASLAHNLPWLRRGGLIFLSWGAEGNTHHAPEPWAAVPVGDVLEWAISHGLRVLDATWEGHRYTDDCAGCYDMVLVKPRISARGVRGGTPRIEAPEDSEDEDGGDP